MKKLAITKKQKEKIQEENKNVTKGATSFNTPIAKYNFTPSYIELGGRWATLLKVVNTPGMNHDKPFSWFVDVLPNIDIEGVKGVLLAKDQIKLEEDEKNLQAKELDNLQKGIENSELGRFAPQAEKDAKTRNLEDIDKIKGDLVHNAKIVDADIILLIYSDSPDKIAEQINRQQRYFDRQINGLQLVSVGGDQERLLSTLFDRLEPSRYNYTWSNIDFAGNDHMIRKGLADEEGWSIGELSLSYTQGAALMDMEKRFNLSNQRNVGQFVVAANQSAKIRGYDGYRTLSASSAWGQLIANKVMTNNYKVFHVVMNGFDYYQSLSKGEGKYVVRDSFLDVAQYINVGQGGLNFLEGFGDIEVEAADAIYNQKIDSLAQIFYILSGRDIEPRTVQILKKAIMAHYGIAGYWDDLAAKDGLGHHNRFISQKDHKKVHPMGELMKGLSNLMTQVTSGEAATESRKDSVTDIVDVLDNAIAQHKEIYNNYTTLPNWLDDKYYQYYFDLSRLRMEQNHLEAQFINVLPYIIANAKKDDVIIFHGLDKIKTDTFSFMKKYIDQAREKGIRFGYLFDTIGGNSVSSESNDAIKGLDLFNAKGIVYDNIETGFDYNILGTMNNDELEAYKQLVSTTGELPEYIEKELSSIANPNPYNYQVSSPGDMTRNTIIANFGI